MANEAAKRVKVDRSNKDKFVIRKNANNNGGRQGSKLVTKESLSPKYQELKKDIQRDSKRPSANNSKSPASIGGNKQSQTQKRRQIDTNQMLSDLRESMKARDSVQAKKQISIGEKMSLTGDFESYDA